MDATTVSMIDAVRSEALKEWTWGDEQEVVKFVTIIQQVLAAHPDTDVETVFTAASVRLQPEGLNEEWAELAKKRLTDVHQGNLVEIRKNLGEDNADSLWTEYKSYRGKVYYTDDDGRAYILTVDAGGFEISALYDEAAGKPISSQSDSHAAVATTGEAIATDERKIYYTEDEHKRAYIYTKDADGVERPKWYDEATGQILPSELDSHAAEVPLGEGEGHAEDETHTRDLVSRMLDELRQEDPEEYARYTPEELDKIAKDVIRQSAAADSSSVAR